MTNAITSDYFKEQKAHNDRLENLTKSLAPLLGGSVKPKRDEEDTQCVILLDQGASIYVHYSDYKKNKFQFSGEFPRDHNRHCYFPSEYDKLNYTSINCSLEKTPEKIAKDIQARFLPGYLEAYSVMLKRAQSQDSYYNTSIATAERLASFCKTKVNEDYHSKKKSANFSVQFGEISVGVECSRENVQMSVGYVSPEIAEQIIHILKKA